jgi:hypothetical protein
MQARGTHVRQPQLGQEPFVAGPAGSDEADGTARFFARHGLVLHRRRRRRARPAHPQPRRVDGGGCSLDDPRRLLCGGELAAESIAGCGELGQLPLRIRAQSHFALVAGCSELGQLLLVLGRLPLRIRAQSRLALVAGGRELGLALVASCTEVCHSSLGVREISASRSKFGQQCRLALVASCTDLGQLLLLLLLRRQLLGPW